MAECSELAIAVDEMVRIIAMEPGVNTLEKVMPRLDPLVPGLSVETVQEYIEAVRIFEAEQNEKESARAKSQFQSIRNEAKDEVEIRQTASRIEEGMPTIREPKPKRSKVDAATRARKENLSNIRKEERALAKLQQQEEKLARLDLSKATKRQKADVPERLQEIRDKIKRVNREIALRRRIEDLAAKEAELAKVKPGQLPKVPPRPDPYRGDRGLQKLQLETDLIKKRIRQRENELAENKGVFFWARRVSREMQTLLTIGEFSGALNQGGNFFKRHPVLWAKAYVGGGLKSVKSELDAHNVIQAILESPNADLYIRGGLDITDPSDVVANREEGLMGAGVNAIPGLKQVGRFHSGMLNAIRKLEFDMMVEALGGREAMTDEILKDIGNWANIVSGRGRLSGLEKSAVALADIAFAPRWYSSRFQMLTGMPIWKASTPQVRNYIIRQYARWALGHAAFHLGVAMLIASMADDENETDEFSIEWNPTATDFGKIKIGNTRLDVMEGMQTWVRFFARVGLGERKTSSGEIIKLKGEDKAFGVGVGEEIFRFGRTKTSVLLGTIIDFSVGEDFKGDPVTFKNALQNRGVLPQIEDGAFIPPGPITYGDIAKVMQEDMGIPEKMALSILAFNGAFVTTYEQNNSKKKKKFNDPRGTR